MPLNFDWYPSVGKPHLSRGTAWQIATIVLTATTSLAATGTWNSNLSAPGNWSDASKWVGGIPNAAGDTANITHNITAARTIHLAGDKTVGNLNIGDSVSPYAAFTIREDTPPDSKLIFDQSGTAEARLTVPTAVGAAANEIATRILLKDDLAITTGTADRGTLQLTFFGPIHDGGAGLGITKNGQGIIRFSASNFFSGGLSINGGRVDASEPHALGGGPVSVASGGQVNLLQAGNGNPFTIAGNGYSNTADPTAQAGAIRIANNLAVVGNIHVQPTGSMIGVSGSDIAFLTGNLSGTGDLGINGPGTTTGGIRLSGSGVNYTGNLQVARGDFAFNDSLGGRLTVSPASGNSTTLVAGNSVSGDVTIDSSAGLVTFRNSKGTLSIGGNLNLEGTTRFIPASFPAPGTSTHTVINYASKTGSGGFSFDATGYRGTPTVSVGPVSAVITGFDGQTRTWTNGSGNANWSVGPSLNWAEGDQLFQHADAVIFDDTAPGTVNIVGTVTPHSVTFNSTGTNHPTLAGIGSIDGAGGGIIKNGDAWLTLGGVNTFTGPVMVNAGRLIVGSTGGLGQTSGVHVAAGAVLDLNGKVVRTTDAWIAGTGDGVVPTITDVTGSGGLRNVTLTADASFGGASGKTFTLGYSGVIDGAGFTFTKVGANEVYMLGEARNLHTVVESGTLSGWGTDPFGSSLRVMPGAIVKLSRGGVYSSNVTFEATTKVSRLIHDGFADSIWTGDFTADGDVRISNNSTSSTLTIANGLKVAGRLTISGDNLRGSYKVFLLGAADVGSHVSVSGHILSLGNGGTEGSISSNAPLLIFGPSQVWMNRSDSFTMPNPLLAGDGSSFLKLGNGTLTMTGDSIYRGTIRVNEGSLLSNGNNTDLGAIVASAGTMLGGKGTVPGAVTIDVGATLAPGDAIGTFTVGSVNRTATINGTLRIEYDSSAPVSIDLLAANGPLALGASSALILESVGRPLGGAVHPIATTTARSGTFASITGLPAGYALAYSDTAIYLIDSDYQSWISSHHPGSTDLTVVGPGADPDGDDLDNMTERLLGTDPASFSHGLELVSSTSTSLTFRHSRTDAPVPYFTGTYEWSLDLTNWNASGATVNDITVNITSDVWQDNPSPSSDLMQVVASVSGGSAAKVFVRHKTTTP